MALTVPIVTIDGPSGSGKGTAAALLAQRLGWHRLDSGALYRVLALAALRRGVSLEAEEPLARLAREMRVEFPAGDGPERILLDGEDVAGELRSEQCGAAASRIAPFAAVRRALLARQRAFARPPGLVADGRDMGTVVFPAAPLKVFLTAGAEERAVRRYKQLKEKGIDVSLRDLSGDIAERDRRDASRPVAPLRPAADARLLDSTSLTPQEVVARISDWIETAGIGPREA